MKLQLNIFTSLTFASLIILVFSYSSCRKGGRCEEPLDIRQSEIVCIFKNSSGSYLYTEVKPLYNKDSLKVFDETGNRYSVIATIKSAPDNPAIGVNFLSFGPIFNPQTDASSFNSEICKNFIIKYAYNQTDTIKTCYKVLKTECGSIFSILKVFHKGVLLIEESNTILTTITIVKN